MSNYTAYAYPPSMAKRKLLPFLNQSPIENDMMVRNIDTAQKGCLRGEALFAAVCAEEKSVLAAVHREPWALQLYAPQSNLPDEALQELLALLARTQRPYNLVCAETELVRRFCLLLEKSNTKHFTRHSGLTLYEFLSAHMRPQQAKGELRPAVATDMRFLPDWFAAFRNETGLLPLDLDRATDTAREHVANKSSFLLCNADGQVMSMAASHPMPSGYAKIGMVYTPPHLRGLGYSKACVSQLCAKLFQEGFSAISLYADSDYPSSNAVYQAVGFVPTNDSEQWNVV
jgi:predicted GNAT family acetyltransferase